MSKHTTARELLVEAARIIGEKEYEEFAHSIPLGFLKIQTALDILDSGIGLDSDADEFVKNPNNLSGFKNYQNIVGLQFHHQDLTKGVPPNVAREIMNDIKIATEEFELPIGAFVDISGKRCIHCGAGVFSTEQGQAPSVIEGVTKDKRTSVPDISIRLSWKPAETFRAVWFIRRV